MLLRRNFLRVTAALPAVLACRPNNRTTQAPTPSPDTGPPLAREPSFLAASPKKILVLGGTGFLGPHLVDAMVARGHIPTLFNRGKTRPELFPDVEKLRGDRDGDLTALAGRQWDAVIDTSGYVPRIVRASAELLAPQVEQYIFISSISVYTATTKPGIDESHPVATMPDPSSEFVMEHYGALKALCEQAAEAALPGRTTAVRPGLIVGPGDPTDRFTYWPVRIDRGGDALIPGSKEDPVQIIDVRDLADFIITAIEQRHMGTFNACGPGDPLTIGELLGTCNKISGSQAQLTWAPTEFLAEHKLEPWSDMPVWVPPVEDGVGMMTINHAKAVTAGLRHRPVADTVKATLEWWKTLPGDRQAELRAGISRAREAEVLAAWHTGQRSAKRHAVLRPPLRHDVRAWL